MKSRFWRLFFENAHLMLVHGDEPAAPAPTVTIHLAQSYLFRPLPSQPSHRTAIPNLYMLGAGTWPGHGVNGGSGYIVARQILGS